MKRNSCPLGEYHNGAKYWLNITGGKNHQPTNTGITAASGCLSTSAHNGLYDITRQVEAIVTESGIQTGLVNVYVQGATSAIMIEAI